MDRTGIIVVTICALLLGVWFIQEQKKQMTTNDFATLNTGATAPVLAILGDASLVGDGNFTLTKTADGVRAEKVFADGLQLVKEFHISSNYLVNASVSLKNNSDKPLALP